MQPPVTTRVMKARRGTERRIVEGLRYEGVTREIRGRSGGAGEGLLGWLVSPPGGEEIAGEVEDAEAEDVSRSIEGGGQ